MASFLLLLVGLLGGTFPSQESPGSAQTGERILRYHVDVRIDTVGRLDVTESITVRAEGRDIRRGIYRDFPTRYRDRHGNRVVVDYEVVEVLRDGRSEPWFTERRPNGVRLNTGDDEFLPTPGEFTYTLRYRTHRQVGFFEDHDEIYWNVTGTGWSFPIDRASAEIRLPSPIDEERLEIDYYTGPQGAGGRDAWAEVIAPGVVRVATNAALGPREGLTVAVGFPKGVVAEPTRAQRVGWLLHDNRGVLIVLAGLLLVLPFYLWRWNRRGRGPAPGTVIPRYQAPEGHPPGGVRYLRRMGYDHRCFAADAVDMGVAGILRIHRDMEGRKEMWRLERLEDPPEGHDPAQAALHTALFEKGGSLELGDKNAARVSAARTAHNQALGKRYGGHYFVTNVGTVTAGMVASGFVLGMALLVAQGDGLPAILLGGGVLLAVNVVFAFLMRAPTDAGRKLLDEIEGLRLYLSVAERDELGGMRFSADGEPDLTPERYQALLPHALALGVEEAWTGKFVSAVGAAAADRASQSFAWYGGSAAHMAGIGAIGQSLGTGLSTQIASSSTPPGSSSGVGGGGFSGGGGGGGGGGGR